MSRQGRPWSGSGTSSGVATLFGPTKQFFVTTMGSVGVTEVSTETSRSTRSDVRGVDNNAILHPAGSSMEVYVPRAPASGPLQRGAVIGLGQTHKDEDALVDRLDDARASE
jgi:hypothetical protein